jgi:hypothetical protein
MPSEIRSAELAAEAADARLPKKHVGNLGNVGSLGSLGRPASAVEVPNSPTTFLGRSRLWTLVNSLPSAVISVH